MFLVTVIPIARGVFKDNLTYFTSQAVTPGTVVSVPLRGREADALVTTVSPLAEERLRVRQADFGLRKISRVKCQSLLTAPFLEAVVRAADYFVAPPGQILKAVFPQAVLRVGSAGELTGAVMTSTSPSPVKPEKFVFQESDAERLSFYKSYIRGEFAKNLSVLFCLPTVEDIHQLLASLEKGIQEYTIVLHGQLSARALQNAWRQALDQTHPVLIVVTPLFLGLPRADLRTIILDRENSSAYKMIVRPFLDYRRFAEFLAAATRAKLIFGDVLLRVETVYRANPSPDGAGEGEFLPLMTIKQRAISEAEPEIIPVTGAEVLGRRLAELTAAAAENNERVFIFSARRGLAPVVVCQDCGQLVLCRECRAPMVLHEPAVFLCHKCGSRRSAKERCANCQGWRLQELGLGIEKVLAAIRTAWPRLTVFRLDSDSVRGGRRAEELVRKFLATPGGVLLGTEMALHYLKDRVENSFVVGSDSLLALPDFRINEKFFTTLIRIRALTAKRLAIQTRYPDHSLFAHALKGNLLDFYREEITERRAFDYPPFRLFVKVSRRGNDKEEISDEIKALARRLVDWEPAVFPALHGVPGGQHQLNLLMKLDLVTWVDKELLAILRSLSPSFVVTVDPESLL